MADNKQQTPDNPLTYLEELKNIRCIHKNIQDKINILIKILELRKTPSMQILGNLNEYGKIIDTELKDEEFGMVYSNIDLLSIHLPNLIREYRNWNTLQQEEIRLLADYIREIIQESNEIKEKIINIPIKQKTDLMDEQEKIAFGQVQRKDLNRLKEQPNKIAFVTILKNITDRCNTQEKKILTDNICLEFYGKKAEDMEWKIGKKNKITAKSAK